MRKYTNHEPGPRTRLLELRDAHPALGVGAHAPVEGTPEGVFAYLRTHGHERFLVALNTTGRVASLRLPAVGPGTIVLSTGATETGTVDLADAEFGPDEASSSASSRS